MNTNIRYRHNNERVGIFIDSQNLYHSAKNLHNACVNYEVLLKEALAGRHLTQAIAYLITTKTGEGDENLKEAIFFNALETIGIETKTKPLQIFPDGNKKGNWDVGMTVDIMDVAPKLNLSTIVLISGDGDFIPLVEYLQEKNYWVEVIAFRRTTSSDLIKVVNKYTNLEKDTRKYLFPR